MVSIVRREPVGDLFDDFFKGFFVKPLRYEPSDAVRSMSIDVSEQAGNYTVHADLPGAKKEDIQVQIDGDVVSISAEIRSEKSAKEGESIVHSERHYGKVARSFRLGQDIDEAGAQAKFSNGVLELTLPKKAASSARRLTIQ